MPSNIFRTNPARNAIRTCSRKGLIQDGITAHLYYDENEKKLDLQCISCHLDAGHYNPDYKHGKLTGIPGAATATVDTSLYFKTATPVTSFTDYTEQIPGNGRLRSKWSPFRVVHSKWVAADKDRSIRQRSSGSKRYGQSVLYG